MLSSNLTEISILHSKKQLCNFSELFSQKGKKKLRIVEENGRN